MIHYHGGPVTPATCAVHLWTKRHAFVSFADHSQLGIAAEVSQSFALDNGAFSIWKSGRDVKWSEYYDFVNKWRNHPGFDFAVIPDVINGTESENDDLLREFPFPAWVGAPVWHTNESIARFVRLAKAYPRVCIGSSQEYDVSRVEHALERLTEAFQAVAGTGLLPITKVHGLRMLNPKIFTQLPFASVDSTNIARNIKIDKAWRGTYQPMTKEARIQVMVDRIEYHNSAQIIPFHIPGL